MRRLRFLLICIILGSSAAAYGAERYKLTPIGSATGNTLAQGINAYGQVVGGDGGLADGAFLWMPTRPNGTRGTTIEIDGVGEASAINAYGQVVGCTPYCNTSSAISKLWTPSGPNETTGSWTNFPFPIGGFIEARAINDRGQVVVNYNQGGGSRTFLWTPTTTNGTIGTAVSLGDQLRGFGINSYGQVTGSDNAISAPFAIPSSAIPYLWTPNAPNGSVGSIQAIGLSGRYTWDINDMGQVVGGGTSINAFL